MSWRPTQNCLRPRRPFGAARVVSLETAARVDGGNLWIIGGGDAAFHIIDGYSYPDKFLDELAAALRKRGSTSFQNLIVDARYFDDVYQHPYWPGDQLRKRYAAPVSGLPYARGWCV